MHCAFRVDASTAIGTGHVMRCLNLAAALTSRGAQVTFVSRPHGGHLNELIAGRGFNVISLPAIQPPHPPQSSPAHAAWLGVDWHQDAMDTSAAIAALTIDWLVVDHYALDARWEGLLRQQARRLMVIDDLADRPHDCDLLLDQNWFGPATCQRYNALVPKRARTLLGPRYALLGSDYAGLAKGLANRHGEIRRILVFLGGSDSGNLTRRVLLAVSRTEFSECQVDVVIGVNHPDPQGIEQLVAARPGTTLLRQLPSLAPLMASADLMIGAGGISNWERLALGLPAIVIAIADNQLAPCQALADAELIDYLGTASAVSETDIASAIRRAIQCPAEWHERSTRMREFASPFGAESVADVLVSDQGEADAPAPIN